MKTKLSIKKQIKFFEGVKSDLISNGCITGLCRMVCSRMNKVYYSYELIELIPSFTRENALKLSQKYGFTKPRKTAVYWWRAGTMKSRLAFVNALLKELKLKLK